MQAALERENLKMWEVRENLLCSIRKTCIWTLKDTLRAFEPKTFDLDANEKLKGELKISIAPLLKNVVVLKDLDQTEALEVAQFILLGGVHHKSKVAGTKPISDMMVFFGTDVGIWSVKPGNFFKMAAPQTLEGFNLKVANSATLEDDCVCFDYNTSVGYIRAYRATFAPSLFALEHSVAVHFGSKDAFKAIEETEDERRADLIAAENRLNAVKASCKTVDQLCAAYAAYSQECSNNHKKHFPATSKIDTATTEAAKQLHRSTTEQVRKAVKAVPEFRPSPVPFEEHQMVPNPASQVSKATCYFFSQSSGCKNGTNCRFTHTHTATDSPVSR
jgi:hypothetical protein